MASVPYVVLWALISSIFSCLFVTSVWRDLRRNIKACLSTPRVWINSWAALYNIAVGFAEVLDNADIRPPLLLLSLVSVIRVSNFMVSLVILCSYMDICSFWIDSDGFVCAKWCARIILLLFLLAWLVIDRGQTFEQDAFHIQPRSDNIVANLMPMYYAITFLMEVMCCFCLWYLRHFIRIKRSSMPESPSDCEALESQSSDTIISDLFASTPDLPALSASPWIQSHINSVLRWNFLVALATTFMLVIQLQPVKERLEKEQAYGGIMLALYFFRYVGYYMIAKPSISSAQSRNDVDAISTSLLRSVYDDFEDALHCAEHTSKRQLECYPFRRGRGIFIFNSKYRESSRYRHLPQDDSVVSRLCLAIGTLGFFGIRFDDLTGEQIRTRFNEFVKQSGEDDVDGIALTFLGHGDRNYIIGVDGVRVGIQELKEMIWREPMLANRPKPKILIFDCCRGQAIEFARRSQVSFSNRVPARSGSLQTQRSVHADFFECHATVEGFAAHNLDGGGLFSRALVEAIERSEGVTDVADLFTQAKANVSTRRIGHGFMYKQCPEVTTTFTKILLLKSPSQRSLASVRRASEPPPSRSNDALLDVRERAETV